MKQLVIYVLLLFVWNLSQAQVITIKNQTTQEPLEDVNILCISLHLRSITNAKGQADISAFKNADTILIRRIRYKEEKFTYAALKAMRFSVEMIENNVALGEMIISSNRWDQRKVETPNRIEVINMKEAAFQNPQTAADLLGMSGYAFIQKSQLG